MNSLNALTALSMLAPSQKGYVSTAQAESVGVGRMDLSRLCKRGLVVRVSRGIYRMSAAPEFRYEDIWVAWIALEPEQGVASRPLFDAAASHHTASYLLGLGELDPNPLTFTCTIRRRFAAHGLRIVRSNLGPEDLTFIDGIPCTNAQRTIIDLVASGEDISLVANVLNDALGRGLILNENQLALQIDQFGKKRGLQPNASLYQWMRSSV